MFHYYWVYYILHHTSCPTIVDGNSHSPVKCGRNWEDDPKMTFVGGGADLAVGQRSVLRRGRRLAPGRNGDWTAWTPTSSWHLNIDQAVKSFGRFTRHQGARCQKVTIGRHRTKGHCCRNRLTWFWSWSKSWLLFRWTLSPPLPMNKMSRAYGAFLK